MNHVEIINRTIYNYLYIERNKRALIIPGLGALVLSDSDSRLSFADYVKKDDGILVQLLQQEHEIGSDKAREIIADYVKKIKGEMAVNGEFIIENVGRLYFADGHYTISSFNAVAQSRPQTTTLETPVIDTEDYPLKMKVSEPLPAVTSSSVLHTAVPNMMDEETSNDTDKMLQKKSKRSDTIMLIAIIAASIAIAAMLYGLFADRPNNIEPLDTPTQQNDTVG